jgi:hypothetical protein
LVVLGDPSFRADGLRLGSEKQFDQVIQGAEPVISARNDRQEQLVFWKWKRLLPNKQIPVRTTRPAADEPASGTLVGLWPIEISSPGVSLYAQSITLIVG